MLQSALRKSAFTALKCSNALLRATASRGLSQARSKATASSWRFPAASRWSIHNLPRRHFSWTPTRLHDSKDGTCSHTNHPEANAASTEASSSTPAASPGTPLTQPDEPRMAIAFTCTVEGCGHRQAHMFTKRSYERGIVIVTCSGCKNRHLIADHLGWFKNLTEEGTHVTIEKLAKLQGQQVTRGSVDVSGVLEYAGEAEAQEATQSGGAAS